MLTIIMQECNYSPSEGMLSPLEGRKNMMFSLPSLPSSSSQVQFEATTSLCGLQMFHSATPSLVPNWRQPQQSWLHQTSKCRAYQCPAKSWAVWLIPHGLCTEGLDIGQVSKKKARLISYSNQKLQSFWE